MDMFDLSRRSVREARWFRAEAQRQAPKFRLHSDTSRCSGEGHQGLAGAGAADPWLFPRRQRHTVEASAVRRVSSVFGKSRTHCSELVGDPMCGYRTDILTPAGTGRPAVVRPF